MILYEWCSKDSIMEHSLICSKGRDLFSFVNYVECREINASRIVFKVDLGYC